MGILSPHLLYPLIPLLTPESAEYFVEELLHRSGIAKGRREAVGFRVSGIHREDRMNLAAGPGSIGARQIEASDLEP